MGVKARARLCLCLGLCVRVCVCVRVRVRDFRRERGTWGRALDHAFAPALYALCLVSVRGIFFFFSSLVFYKLQSRAESRTPLASVQRHKRGPRRVCSLRKPGGETGAAALQDGLFCGPMLSSE